MTSLLRASAGWIFVGCASSAACALVGYDFDGYSTSGAGGSGGSDTTTSQASGTASFASSGASGSASGSGGSQPCLDVADCNDMNLCTTDVCSSGLCGHVPIVEDDANACTADGCNLLSGQPTHTAIDDCCPHSVCTAGVPLSGNCLFAGAPTNCVPEVCGSLPKCCSTGWDAECVTNAEIYCSTAQITCTCAHSYCVTGGPLANLCDPCVAAVCQANAACCTTLWDAACVSATHTLCNIPLGADCQ